MYKRLVYFLFFTLIYSLVSCDKLEESRYTDEIAKLEAWILVNNIQAELKPSGLYFIENQVGTGITPEVGDYIIYSYVEKTLEGYVFRSCIQDTAELWDFYSVTTHYVPAFILNQTPKTYQFPIGLPEAFSYMKEGGKATVIFQSNLAYGKSGLSSATNSNVSIGSYTTIIADIELIKVIKDPEVYEQGLIQDSVDQYHPGFEPTTDGIYFINLKTGTGSSVADDSTVYVKYTGMYLDGFVFDSNVDSVIDARGLSTPSDTSLSFVVGSSATVIKGFNYAVKLMQENGKAKVIIPSINAYGVYGSSNIPPYTPLIFEIELEKVDKKEASSKP